jgi:hypothetical protein
VGVMVGVVAGLVVGFLAGLWAFRVKSPPRGRSHSASRARLRRLASVLNSAHT